MIWYTLIEGSSSTDVKKLAKTLQDSNLDFKYSALEKATNNFSLDNKIGQGGFGSVYKVVLFRSISAGPTISNYD